MPPTHFPWRKTPAELQLMILEEALISEKPITVGPGFTVNYYLADFLFWTNQESCTRFLELLETFPMVPYDEMKQHYGPRQYTLNEIHENFMNNVWNFLNELKTKPKILASHNEITTRLFQVNRQISDLALQTFYSKNTFTFPLGFVFLEAWARTIGQNRRFLASIHVNIGVFPQPRTIGSNIFGWVLDVESEHLGLMPRQTRHPRADNRILGSLEMFKEYFMGPQTALKHLHLEGTPAYIRRSGSRGECKWKAQGVIENDPISQMIRLVDGEPNFEVKFTTTVYEQRKHLDLRGVHEFVAREVKKLGWVH